jgi:hypothetical protein
MHDKKYEITPADNGDVRRAGVVPGGVMRGDVLDV